MALVMVRFRRYMLVYRVSRSKRCRTWGCRAQRHRHCTWYMVGVRIGWNKRSTYAYSCGTGIATRRVVDGGDASPVEKREMRMCAKRAEMGGTLYHTPQRVISRINCCDVKNCVVLQVEAGYDPVGGPHVEISIADVELDCLMEYGISDR